jgi:hypothetical protein
MSMQQTEVDNPSAAIEMYYSRGWTDGLPVVPPTAQSINAMLGEAHLHAQDEIAYIQHRQVSVKAQKAAINAVMAGCLPEYMPVVVAALQAMADPLFGYHGAATSTGGAGILMVVNGPIVKRLALNCRDDLFGTGWRANATIGRAVRLIMRNVIGTLPGKLDRSTLGHAGKFTYCIAENEEDSPWPPLHVERGFEPHQSAVTVFAALAPHQFYDQLSASAQGLLTTACAHMRISAGVRNQPQYFLILAGEHMDVIARDGWSKEEVKRFCYEHTQTSLAELKRLNIADGDVEPEDEHRMRPLVPAPEDFIVVPAGGRAGAFSAYIPGWGGKKTSQSVTREILQS